MQRPPLTEPLTHAEVRTLVALCAVHQRDGRATFRAVAQLLGRSLSTTRTHLLALHRHGWCSWEDGGGGSLRPHAIVTACVDATSGRLES